MLSERDHTQGGAEGRTDSPAKGAEPGVADVPAASHPRPADDAERAVRQAVQANPVMARDIVTLARMTEIYCAGHHRKADRVPYDSVAVRAGAFGSAKVPLLCPDCAEHMRYGEQRRALCPKDPKPSCRTCDIHCYSREESEWQRASMAYAGPRAPFHGLLREALSHLYQDRIIGGRQDRAKRERRDRDRGQDY
ncbi:MAG: nitrous oxide-stimulated promoter family protein [Coriobacteriales bacterium]|jgi:hypothetical protein